MKPIDWFAAAGSDPAPKKRDRLEAYRPLLLTPGNWAELLRDDCPVGKILDRNRG